MLKEILALELMIGMACADVGKTESFEFWCWSEEGRAAFWDIVRNPASQRLRSDSGYNVDSAMQELSPQIEDLRRDLDTLSGGAEAIYDRLIRAWSTGDEVWDYTPEPLARLARGIYLALKQP